MTFGSLFSGIGGIDLGLERAGMVCKWQVEKDPYASRVLAKHWPNVRRWADVREFPPACQQCLSGRNDCPCWQADLIAGGFPCQDVSLANQDGDGISGSRSGLWFEFQRVLGILRPRFVFVENVPGLFVRGLGCVLGGLAALGFDAEWSVVSACAMGATHTRERLFILGYAESKSPWRDEGQREARRRVSLPGNRPGQPGTHWASEPAVGRVAYGVPARVDRLRGLGNAVVPQVAEWIGRRIMESA